MAIIERMMKAVPINRAQKTSEGSSCRNWGCARLTEVIAPAGRKTIQTPIQKKQPNPNIVTTRSESIGLPADSIR
jgi:hypothetical protein